MKLSMVIVYVIAASIVGAEIRIRGKVRKRSSARRHRAILPPCPFNETIIENEWSLMEAIGKSKYIFTGKVLNVKKYKFDGKRSNLYRVHLRRVLKGDVSELRTIVKEGSGETLSGSTVMVERLRAREACAPGPRPRLSAIFFSGGSDNSAVRGSTPHLLLLTDPVPLTLYHLDRINAAVTDDTLLEDDVYYSEAEDDCLMAESESMTIRSTVNVPNPPIAPTQVTVPQPCPTPAMASTTPQPRAPPTSPSPPTVPRPSSPPMALPQTSSKPEDDEPSTPAAALDSVILEILGDDPSVVKQYGKEIQTDLAVRLQHIATSGLNKEIRKELCEKYLPPKNCTLIDAPELNPEIKAAVSEAVIKRDKGIELKQMQLGRAISCISEALSILMTKEDKDTSIIKLLMDASRLLCDNQNLDSVTRRNFVLFNLKKEMKDQMSKTKIDKLLFGADLAETLKTAKSISKSGADLKQPASSNKVTANKNPAAAQQLPAPQKRNNLNWKAPPLKRRPQGSQRTKEPASKSRHASSSRTSYRAHHQRYSNRR